jgi:hypothetical protein
MKLLNQNCNIKKTGIMLNWPVKRRCGVIRKRKFSRHIQKFSKYDLTEFITQEMKNRRFIQETLMFL